jgi:hypothetical protein
MVRCEVWKKRIPFRADLLDEITGNDSAEPGENEALAIVAPEEELPMKHGAVSHLCSGWPIMGVTARPYPFPAFFCGP